MSLPNNSPQKQSRVTRSSLACLPCRSRHLKCDAKRPRCTRCAEFARDCEYARSRRGGLDRAALAERRKKLAAPPDDSGIASSPSPQRSAGSQSQQEFATGIVDMDLSHSYGLIDEISMGDHSTSTDSPNSVLLQSSNIEKCPLIGSYYKNFHPLHPFLLPRHHFIKLYNETSQQLSFNALIAVMRLVGNIYKSRQFSTSLRNDLDVALSQLSPMDPFMIQCRILYSVSLFWNEYKDEAKFQIDSAFEAARHLNMFKREFATDHGGQDFVLRESWRRTWWILYTVDAFYAGTLGTMNFAVVNIEADVELPCEESEYERGVSTLATL